jgi:hypothetical protein
VFNVSVDGVVSDTGSTALLVLVGVLEGHIPPGELSVVTGYAVAVWHDDDDDGTEWVSSASSRSGIAGLVSVLDSGEGLRIGVVVDFCKFDDLTGFLMTCEV